MKVCFDENTPPVVAKAVALLVQAETRGAGKTIEVVHALDIARRDRSDVVLIQALAGETGARVVLITADKALRTRQHERAAFADTGCIGIVLTGQWSHAPLWDRARMTLTWWPTWMTSVEKAAPGTLWNCPWSERPRALRRA